MNLDFNNGLLLSLNNKLYTYKREKKVETAGNKIANNIRINRNEEFEVISDFKYFGS